MRIALHPYKLGIEPAIKGVGGPRKRRTFLEDANGDAQQQIPWDEFRWEWELIFIGESEEMEYATGFFLARDGEAWLFQDPLDYQASSARGTGIVKTHTDGKRYLFRRYPDEMKPYDRMVLCPDVDTVVFHGVGGTPVVNAYTGEVTGATSDGSADFEFFVPVVFLTEFQQLEREPGDSGSQWKVAIGEVKRYRVVQS